MELKNFVIRNAAGATLPGATVYLYVRGTTTTVPVFDAFGSALTNPFTADSGGRVAFAAAEGTYDFRAVSGILDSTIVMRFQDESDVVKLAGDQTVAGVKTFSRNPISSATQSTATNSLTRRDFVTGLDITNVKLTGNQTIAGVKTFSSTPIAPTAPANDNDTNLATTGWVWMNIQALVASCIAAVATAAGFAVLLNANGYIKLPSWLGGLIIQWFRNTTGITNSGGDFTFTVTFPIAFPVAVLGSSFMPVNEAGISPAGISAQGNSVALSGMQVTIRGGAPISSVGISGIVFGH
jgi:hypothetical protein